MRELSLNVMDIVQNSISAKASLIEIIEDKQGDALEITIRDNGCGMTAEQVESVINPFFTTRTTRSVGLGVPLFKMACEQTGGSFNIESTPNVGTNLTARFITSHIDMTPIGDMTETIVLLVSMNTHIDFVYTNRLNDKDFVFDTREVREVLGEDVPLSDYEVVQWIRENLAEQIAELNQ